VSSPVGEPPPAGRGTRLWQRIAADGRPSLLIASFSGLAIRGGETFARFAMTLLLARRLGPESAGVFFLGLGLLSQFGLTRFALDRALIRHVAIAAPELVRGLAARGIALGLFGPAATGIVMFAAAAWLAAHIFGDPALIHPLRMTALVMVPMALAMLGASVLTGLHHTAAGQLCGSGLWPAICAIGFLLLPLDLDLAFTILLAAASISALLGLLLIRRFTPPARPMTETASVHGARALLATAWPLVPVEAVQLSLVAMPTLLLGTFAGAAEVGLFGVANRYALLLWVVIIAVNAMAGPRFARAHAAGDVAGLGTIARRTVRLTLLAGIPLALLLLVIPGPLLSLLGPDFAGGIALVRIMALGQVVNLLFPCYAEMLAMTGHGRPLRRINLYVLVFCILACLMLIPPFGAMGAAVATALAMVANSIGPALVARAVLDIDPLSWFRRERVG
jgi:O-antigen/teichoic acid export membrane protein